ncbi:hypothetical protein NIES4074_28830 [Cylindrospermum sp. NIES-4074]|nr:hypothetical protein NIES4074_28830 [Cylindrospermum sp. NIES-4074]
MSSETAAANKFSSNSLATSCSSAPESNWSSGVSSVWFQKRFSSSSAVETFAAVISGSLNKSPISDDSTNEFSSTSLTEIVGAASCGYGWKSLELSVNSPKILTGEDNKSVSEREILLTSAVLTSVS